MIALEKLFRSNITVRGEELIVEGEENEITFINKVVQDCIFTINQKGSLDENDIFTIAKLDKKSNSTQESSLDSIILFTKTKIIKPKNQTQSNYFDAVKKFDLVFSIGPAGTGKTYLAVAMAVAALKEHEVSKIILTRPAVEAGENLGFLPGDFKEKIDPYLYPLYDALAEMLSPETLKKYIEQKIIEVIPLAFMRGRTINNAFIILDEAQNTTQTQMKMFLTRLGIGSKAIVTGDLTQSDLPKHSVSGLFEVSTVLKNIDGIHFIYFDKKDVIRHRLVKDIVEAYEKFNGKS